MSAAVASLPRSAGNGAALVVTVLNFMIELFDKIAEPKAAPAAQALAVEAESAIDVWALYRLGAGFDSVNPKTAAKMREIAGLN